MYFKTEKSQYFNPSTSFADFTYRKTQSVGALTPVNMSTVVRSKNLEELEQLCGLCEQMDVNPIWFDQEAPKNKVTYLAIFQLALRYNGSVNKIYQTQLDLVSDAVKKAKEKVTEKRNQIRSHKESVQKKKAKVKKYKRQLEKMELEKQFYDLKKIKEDLLAQQKRLLYSQHEESFSTYQQPQPQPQIIFQPYPYYPQPTNSTQATQYPYYMQQQPQQFQQFQPPQPPHQPPHQPPQQPQSQHPSLVQPSQAHPMQPHHQSFQGPMLHQYQTQQPQQPQQSEQPRQRQINPSQYSQPTNPLVQIPTSSPSSQLQIFPQTQNGRRQSEQGQKFYERKRQQKKSDSFDLKLNSGLENGREKKQSTSNKKETPKNENMSTSKILQDSQEEKNPMERSEIIHKNDQVLSSDRSMNDLKHHEVELPQQSIIIGPKNKKSTKLDRSHNIRGTDKNNSKGLRQSLVSEAVSQKYDEVGELPGANIRISKQASKQSSSISKKDGSSISRKDSSFNEFQIDSLMDIHLKNQSKLQIQPENPPTSRINKKSTISKKLSVETNLEANKFKSKVEQQGSNPSFIEGSNITKKKVQTDKFPGGLNVKNNAKSEEKSEEKRDEQQKEPEEPEEARSILDSNISKKKGVDNKFGGNLRIKLNSDQLKESKNSLFQSQKQSESDDSTFLKKSNQGGKGASIPLFKGGNVQIRQKPIGNEHLQDSKSEKSMIKNKKIEQIQEEDEYLEDFEDPGQVSIKISSPKAQQKSYNRFVPLRNKTFTLKSENKISLSHSNHFDIGSIREVSNILMKGSVEKKKKKFQSSKQIRNDEDDEIEFDALNLPQNSRIARPSAKKQSTIQKKSVIQSRLSKIPKPPESIQKKKSVEKNQEELLVIRGEVKTAIHKKNKQEQQKKGLQHIELAQSRMMKLEDHEIQVKREQNQKQEKEKNEKKLMQQKIKKIINNKYNQDVTKSRVEPMGLVKSELRKNLQEKNRQNEEFGTEDVIKMFDQKIKMEKQKIEKRRQHLIEKQKQMKEVRETTESYARVKRQSKKIEEDQDQDQDQDLDSWIQGIKEQIKEQELSSKKSSNKEKKSRRNQVDDLTYSTSLLQMSKMSKIQEALQRQNSQNQQQDKVSEKDEKKQEKKQRKWSSDKSEKDEEKSKKSRFIRGEKKNVDKNSLIQQMKDKGKYHVDDELQDAVKKLSINQTQKRDSFDFD